MMTIIQLYYVFKCRGIFSSQNKHITTSIFKYGLVFQVFFRLFGGLSCPVPSVGKLLLLPWCQNVDLQTRKLHLLQELRQKPVRPELTMETQ